MAGPRRMSLRRRQAVIKSKLKQENARAALTIRELKAKLAMVSRDLDRAAARIQKLEKSAAA